jgi:hypothetical protein
MNKLTIMLVGAIAAGTIEVAGDDNLWMLDRRMELISGLRNLEAQQADDQSRMAALESAKARANGFLLESERKELAEIHHRIGQRQLLRDLITSINGQMGRAPGDMAPNKTRAEVEKQRAAEEAARKAAEAEARKKAEAADSGRMRKLYEFLDGGPAKPASTMTSGSDPNRPYRANSNPGQNEPPGGVKLNDGSGYVPAPRPDEKPGLTTGLAPWALPQPGPTNVTGSTTPPIGPPSGPGASPGWSGLSSHGAGATPIPPPLPQCACKPPCVNGCKKRH